MIERASIEFVEVSEPIMEPVTKFGGQPVWLSAPQWPLSRITGRPMQFIGQVALYPDLFAGEKRQTSPLSDPSANIPAQMAYLFISDDPDGDETWDPDNGENAVIIQPGDAPISVQNLAEGPTLYRMVEQPNSRRVVPEPCEYAVRLTRTEDPDFEAEEDRYAWKAEQAEDYRQTVAGNKIGGAPGFVQGDEFPGDDCHTLLLQLDASTVPFYVNFGDGGVGYAFLSQDRRSGKFLWQCS